MSHGLTITFVKVLEAGDKGYASTATPIAVIKKKLRRKALCANFICFTEAVYAFKHVN